MDLHNRKGRTILSQNFFANGYGMLHSWKSWGIYLGTMVSYATQVELCCKQSEFTYTYVYNVHSGQTRLESEVK